MVDIMLAAGSSRPTPPAEQWYTGNELIAFDSYNFNSSGFTDYTGKPITCGNTVAGVIGEFPSRYTDYDFKYGTGIRLGSSANIYAGSGQIPTTTFTGSWSLDFWVKCDLPESSTSVAFSNGFYLYAYDDSSSANRNNNSRYVLGPNTSGNYFLSIFNNAVNPKWTATSKDTALSQTTWVHFAVTYNGTGTTRFFINGTLSRTASYTNLNPSAALQVGVCGFQQYGNQKMVIERYRFRSGVCFPTLGFDLSTIYDISAAVTPGPVTLSAGTSALGYYGEVSSSDMILGQNLADYVGLATTNLINNTGNWLCYSLNGKRIYVAKKPILNLISWNTINAQGLVTGTNVVQIHGVKYKVRLLTGVNGSSGEWNSLIYRVHVNDPTGSHWASFTNSDIVVGTGSGRTTWCQEDVSGAKVYRGYASLTDYQSGQPTSATDTTGWRPVLEPL